MNITFLLLYSIFIHGDALKADDVVPMKSIAMKKNRTTLNHIIKKDNKRFRIDKKTDMPMSISQINYQAKGETPEELADDFLRNNHELIGLQNKELDEFLHYKTFTGPAGHTVRYKQIHMSIPVYDTDLAVTIDFNNTVNFVTSNFKTGIQLRSHDIYPRLPIKRILQAASKKFKAISLDDIRFRKEELMIKHDEKSTRLIWKLNIVPNKSPRDMELIFDAMNGKMLSFTDLTQDLRGAEPVPKLQHSGTQRNLRRRHDRKLNVDQNEILHNTLDPPAYIQHLPTDVQIVVPNDNGNNSTHTTLSPSPSRAPVTSHPTFSLPTLQQLPQTGVSTNAYGYVFDPDPLSTAKASYKDDSGLHDNSDMDSPELMKQHINVTLRDVNLHNGIYSLRGPWVQIVDTEAPHRGLFQQNTSNFLFSRSESGFEAVNCYYHIDNFLRYINRELGIVVRPSRYEGGVRVDPHGLDGTDNSHYLAATQELAFGEGGVDDAEDADVIIHELGHGIHDWITAGSYSRIEGLSEGFGDYLAASYGRGRGKWKPSDPEYHNIYNWDGHNEYWGGRTTNNIGKYPDALTGNKHIDGTLWSSCNMKIWDAIGRRKSDTVHLVSICFTFGFQQ